MALWKANLLLLFLCGAQCHICLNYPPQRGGIPVAAFTTPDLPACAIVTSPCGATAAGTPGATFAPGQSIPVNIIINEQHFNTTPGNFTVTYCMGSCLDDANFTIFIGGEVQDTPQPTIPANITIPVTLASNTPTGNMIIRVIYYASPGEDPAAWYQCSDIKVAVPGVPAPASTVDKIKHLTIFGYGITVTFPVIGGILLIIIIVIVIIVVKRRRKRDGYYSGKDYSREPTHNTDTNERPIQMMSMREIQNNRMNVAPEYQNNYVEPQRRQDNYPSNNNYSDTDNYPSKSYSSNYPLNNNSPQYSPNNNRPKPPKLSYGY